MIYILTSLFGMKHIDIGVYICLVFALGVPSLLACHQVKTFVKKQESTAELNFSSTLGIFLTGLALNLSGYYYMSILTCSLSAIFVLVYFFVPTEYVKGRNGEDHFMTSRGRLLSYGEALTFIAKQYPNLPTKLLILKLAQLP